MWEQYCRTFVRMQVTIAVVSLGVYFFLDRLWFQATTFFVVMQIGAIIGAMWGVRLKRMIQGQTGRLPLQSRQ